MESDSKLSFSNEVDDKDFVQQYIGENGIVLDASEFTRKCKDELKMVKNEGFCEDVEIEMTEDPPESISGRCELNKVNEPIMNISRRSIHFKAKQLSHHPANRRLKCYKCDFRSDSVSQLRAHFKNFHPRSTGRIYQCTFCSYISFTTKEKYDHMESLHRFQVDLPKGRRTQKCPFCNISLTMREKYNHIHSHHRVNGDALRTSSLGELKNAETYIIDLSGYESIHMDVRDFMSIRQEIGAEKSECPYCSFSTTDLLDKHTKVCNIERCKDNYCNHKIVDGKAMERSIQDNMKKCSYCDIPFVGSDLSAHMRDLHFEETHHKEMQLKFNSELKDSTHTYEAEYMKYLGSSKSGSVVVDLTS